METVTITEQLIEDGVSSRGGWSDKQFACLGIYFKTKGWKQRLIGTEVNLEKYKEFLALKNVHVKKGRKSKRVKNSVLLEKAIAFILDNFSDGNEKFYCCHTNDCPYGDCEACNIPTEYEEIMSLK
jgi:hypothetical protein